MDAYGLVIRIKDKNFLELSAEGQISYTETIEQQKEYFNSMQEIGNGVTNLFISLAFKSLRARIIKFPDNPTDLKKYVVNENIAEIKDEMFSSSLFLGVELNDDIEELVVEDII